MGSLITGYEYDIFISYRHNDNRSGWVTEFVNALQEELASTIKEPLTIYFDKNPHDGLLETHNVDKSLEGKLKCLIFIPIISQTYCDTKSFAWQHEFVAFNKLAKEDQFGRDIKLSNGNVASRILPIKIHDLDSEDKSLLEKELGGVLRAIEFIFKSAGVNRPLTPTDNPDKNQNKTLYKDQVNKVANAIKEIISSIKNPPSQTPRITITDQPTTKPKQNRKTLIASVVVVFTIAVSYFFYQRQTNNDQPLQLDRSIAVLPFVDMSPEKDQEYLGDGIAEDIITALSKVEGMKVIGRTSSFQFKGVKIDLREVGDKLNVSTVLEGSVMKAGDKIRVTAQLIKVSDGSHIWSERYDRSMNDIFSVQDEIAQHIAGKFRITISLLGSTKSPTMNLEAYEAFLKGKHAYGEGLTGIDEAIQYYEKAVTLDPLFEDAYIELSDTYWSKAIFNQGNKQENLNRAKSIIEKAIEINPNSVKAYALLSAYNALIDWDWKQAKKTFDKALALNGGKPVQDSYTAFVRTIFEGGNEVSVNETKAAMEMDPLSVKALTDLSRMYLYARQFSKVIPVCEKALTLSPSNTSAKRHIGVAYLRLGEYNKALSYFEDLMKTDSNYAPYGYVGSLVKLNRKSEAKEAFNQLPKSVTSVKKAICYIYLGEVDSAFHYLNKGFLERDVNMPFLKIASEYDPIRNDPRFIELIKRMKLP